MHSHFNLNQVKIRLTYFRLTIEIIGRIKVMDAVICAVVIVYIVLGIRWGIRYVDGKWAWL